LYRLLTTGIDKDGNTINHAMPFENFCHLDPTDAKAKYTKKSLRNVKAGDQKGDN